jgi:hypothetical protein
MIQVFGFASAHRTERVEQKMEPEVRNWGSYHHDS